MPQCPGPPELDLIFMTSLPRCGCYFPDSFRIQATFLIVSTSKQQKNEAVLCENHEQEQHPAMVPGTAVLIIIIGWRHFFFAFLVFDRRLSTYPYSLIYHVYLLLYTTYI